eukprot:CAMPEP_0184999608 /NCGR_PEP_ID=MMETSP1098-20130426/66002_1 /TAXON_ID=89044 /ORGANISM="Spumella elongata, Strain CCAP 955/1" /LENGTH=72 /DNA_ID=CAMNT_0027526635 /DNA_START=20 /DNA_END=238 /DNA_ORIENTATION=+
MSTKEVKKDDLPKSALELLEEDDEFEEFEGSSWEDSAAKAEDNQLFQDDWEDDNTNDDFTQQLRAQIESSNT